MILESTSCRAEPIYCACTTTRFEPRCVSTFAVFHNASVRLLFLLSAVSASLRASAASRSLYPRISNSHPGRVCCCGCFTLPVIAKKLQIRDGARLDVQCLKKGVKSGRSVRQVKSREFCFESKPVCVVRVSYEAVASETRASQDLDLR